MNGPAITPGSVPTHPRMCHRRSSIYDVRCRTPLAVYPETGRAARNAPCSTLLRARFTQPTRSHGPLVVSYTTVSPLPESRKTPAVCFLLHFLAGYPGWELPTALLCGARTFLGTPWRITRPSCRPIRVHSLAQSAGRYNPDSPVRTSIALLSGHNKTSSGAAARIAARSNSLSSKPLATEIPPRSRDAPCP